MTMKKTTQYKVTKIKYDTDGYKVKLPKTLVINVPNELKTYEDIEEFISDEISDRTGYCHGGFETTPEIPE